MPCRAQRGGLRRYSTLLYFAGMEKLELIYVWYVREIEIYGFRVTRRVTSDCLCPAAPLFQYVACLTEDM